MSAPVIILSAIAVAICLNFAVRNERVYRLRKSMLEEEANYIREDMAKRWHGYLLRHDESLPSYHRMVLEFWVRLHKYKEKYPLEAYYE